MLILHLTVANRNGYTNKKMDLLEIFNGYTFDRGKK